MMAELAKTVEINGQVFTTLWGGKFLGCDLAIVTADPEVKQLSWVMNAPTGEVYEGTCTKPDDFVGTPKQFMTAILNTIEELYIQISMKEKVEAIRDGKYLQ